MREKIKFVGLVAGPLLALGVSLVLPEVCREGECVALSDTGRATVVVAVWMAVWWLTEAIPVYVTALMHLALFPLLGVAAIKPAAAPYGHELIYLFFGGFVVALAIQRWGLHRRIAYVVLSVVGRSSNHIVGGFMLISALLSMWISNTATTIMLLPIALSVLDVITDESQASSEARRNLGLCMLLGIAYAASIGGIATLIGTPPNLFLASFVEEQIGIEIGFARWMAVGLPISAVLLPVCWLILTRFQYPVDIERLDRVPETMRRSLAELGPISKGERIAMFVFSGMAIGWMLRPILSKITLMDYTPLAGLTDTGIAMMAAIILFVIPVDFRSRKFAMSWDSMAGLPWGVLLLFGGGLSLASAIQANGVSEYLGQSTAGLSELPKILIVLSVVSMVIFLTELTSNIATTATLLPVLAAVAPVLGIDTMTLIVPATIAASCAFMLPVATPPNAVVFGSGQIGAGDMARTGLKLNLIGILVVTGFAYFVVGRVAALSWSQ